MLEGRIYKLLAGTYYVDTSLGAIEAKAKGSFRSESVLPRVGDRVRLESSGGAYRICEILPRRNCLLRPMVSNVDRLVIVLAVQKPLPDLMLAEKMIIASRKADIEPVIAINKSEIDMQRAKELASEFAQADIQTFVLSCREGLGLAEFKAYMRQGVSCFSGQSAVGKSSLTQQLIPGAHLVTGDLSKKTDRGKHTTRHCELYRIDGGGYVADTPGFSLLEEEVIDPAALQELFDPKYSLLSLKCRFSGCSHTAEPDCAVKKAAESGAVSKERYERYCRLYAGIKDNWRKRYD